MKGKLGVAVAVAVVVAVVVVVMVMKWWGQAHALCNQMHPRNSLAGHW